MLQIFRGKPLLLSVIIKLAIPEKDRTGPPGDGCPVIGRAGADDINIKPAISLEKGRPPQVEEDISPCFCFVGADQAKIIAAGYHQRFMVKTIRGGDPDRFSGLSVRDRGDN